MFTDVFTAQVFKAVERKAFFKNIWYADKDYIRIHELTVFFSRFKAVYINSPLIVSGPFRKLFEKEFQVCVQSS